MTDKNKPTNIITDPKTIGDLYNIKPAKKKLRIVNHYGDNPLLESDKNVKMIVDFYYKTVNESTMDEAIDKTVSEFGISKTDLYHAAKKYKDIVK